MRYGKDKKVLACLSLVSVCMSSMHKNLVYLFISKYFSINSPRFGEQSMGRVIRWMEKAEVPKNASILDIGTGNGVLLVELVCN